MYELGWSKVDEDRKILVEELKKIDAYSEMAFVPKKIFTVWVGEEMPENIKKCIKSQKIEGYEHKVIGNDDIPDIPYVKEAICCRVHVEELLSEQEISRNIWIPKSMISNNTIPTWLWNKKVEEVLESVNRISNSIVVSF